MRMCKFVCFVASYRLFDGSVINTVMEGKLSCCFLERVEGGFKMTVEQRFMVECFHVACCRWFDGGFK